MNKSAYERESMALTEAEAIELFAFLISSARTQLDEPCQYASMRLLSAAEILLDFVMTRVSPAARDLMDETAGMMTHAQINMYDVEDYTATLDVMCKKVAEHLVSQSELKGRAS